MSDTNTGRTTKELYDLLNSIYMELRRIDTGPVPISSGGTGAITAPAALTALGALPLAGGIMTGSPVLSNNIALQAKDVGGTTRTIVSYGGDNHINFVNGTGGRTRFYNSAGSTVLWDMDNSGVVNQVGNLIFPNNVGVWLKDTVGTARQLVNLGGDNNVNFTIAGGGSINYYNQAATTVVASLSNAGAFSAVTVAQNSDERKKANWRPLTDDQLDKLANMEKSGLFDWLDGSGESCGGSAQEIRAIVPQAVYEDEEGNLTVNYGGLCFAIQQATLRRLWGSK